LEKFASAKLGTKHQCGQILELAIIEDPIEALKPLKFVLVELPFSLFVMLNKSCGIPFDIGFPPVYDPWIWQQYRLVWPEAVRGDQEPNKNKNLGVK
jgi:hypothetical protein